MKKSVIYLSFILLSILASSCSKEAENQRVTDRQLILSYIEENNLDATGTDSGLFYIIEEPGSTEHPSENSEFAAFYKGKLLNGKIFEQSHNEPYKGSLNNVIEGWKEGIPLIGKGGKIQLLIPSHLGYGQNQSGSIPANSVLLFEVELVDFS
ncbi:MAG: FKBP-type peptidyl-prolyl cis-trans isomerase [Bacteroidales bacterium]|nr:FKBP-type peptidyl-prolyl cis-trans isomerase [Bacteroidales bacterium]